MSFEALIEELEELKVLKKSADQDDKKIQGNENENDDDAGNKDESMGKSMTVTDTEGNVIEAIDGTELVKSLTARLDKQEGDFAAHTEDLMKAMNAIVTTVKDQSEMIKSLRDELSTIRTEGRGRKSMVTMAEKTDTTLQKSQKDGMPGEEFMAKCLIAQKKGRLTALDVSIAEASLNKGVQIPERIVTQVLK